MMLFYEYYDQIEENCVHLQELKYLHKFIILYIINSNSYIFSSKYKK